MTRNEGIMSNTLPTGTQYQIVPLDYNPALYKIKKAGETGPVIDELSGCYTSIKQAMKPLVKHLNEVWDRFEKKSTKDK